MEGFLDSEYTIVTSDGQYIVKSYNGYVSIHWVQCQEFTFKELSKAKELLAQIQETKEFDWLGLYIMKIDKTLL